MAIGFDIIQLVKEAGGLVQRKLAKDKDIQKYLTESIGGSKHLSTEWLPDNSYLLDTERAFVPMRLVGRNGRPESLRAVLGRNERLVIQGQPGAGKSTLVRFITFIMARASADRKDAAALPQKHLQCPALLPLHVSLKECMEGQSIRDLLLCSVRGVQPEFMQKLLDRGGMLILFDGLDEVADAKRRSRVLQEINKETISLASTGAPNRFLVTTRSSSYRHRVLIGGDYALYTLLELAPDQQKEMIRRYYEMWAEKMPLPDGEENSQVHAKNLIEQLDNNQGLARLKSNPLLLSQIAALHFQGKSLPVRRHELYHSCIQHLITRRDTELSQKECKARMVLLGELALAMHQKQRDDCEALDGAEIQRVIEKAMRQRPHSADAASSPAMIIKEMEEDWGLLVNRAGQEEAHPRYSFSNLSFQEYLAAYAIHNDPDAYWPILKAKLRDNWWQEVALLYTAMPTPPGGPSPLDRVITAIIKPDVTPSSIEWITIGRFLASESSHASRNAWHEPAVNHLRDLSRGNGDENADALAALCLIEPDGREIVVNRILGYEGVLVQQQVLGLLLRVREHNDNARQYLRDSLFNKLQERPTERERIALAEALALVIDTRLGQSIPFSAAEEKWIGHDFSIGKYPVSNAEYAEFIEDSGHRKPEHWYENSCPFRKANHPITHLSVPDAHAYCEWLSQRSDRRFRLPSEAEWTTAAREDEPTRKYPWGNRLDQQFLNWRRNVGGTTPVGIYVEGETEYGVADLMGNVWEWTQDREGEFQVLKGGAWDTVDLPEGIDTRRLELPSVRQSNIGFRVVEV